MMDILKYIVYGIVLVFLVVVALFLLSQFGLITFNLPSLPQLW